MGNHFNKIHNQEDIYITCLDDMEKGECRSLYKYKECLNCNIRINFNCSENDLFSNKDCLFCDISGKSIDKYNIRKLRKFVTNKSHIQSLYQNINCNESDNYVSFV